MLPKFHYHDHEIWASWKQHVLQHFEKCLLTKILTALSLDFKSSISWSTSFDPKLPSILKFESVKKTFFLSGDDDNLRLGDSVRENSVWSDRDSFLFCASWSFTISKFFFKTSCLERESFFSSLFKKYWFCNCKIIESSAWMK